jgi:hypothetical protein
MINHVPSNYSSMEVLAAARQENPNPSPVLEELFKRCQKELSDDPPVGAACGSRERRVQRASVR